MKVRMLNAQDVRALLPMGRCIDLMRKAMLLLAQKRTLHLASATARQRCGTEHSRDRGD
jgi:hypothetical protein